MKRTSFVLAALLMLSGMPANAASILFGVIAVEDAHGVDLGPVFVVMSWTVLLSIVVHGLSAGPAAAAYGRWWDSMSD